MNQNINLNLYKVFYYVAIYKSFNKASIELCVSQPAISKQIKNLEYILGVKLFYRFNKGIELTNEGKILLEQIEQVNFYLEASNKYVYQSKKLMFGELIIGCPSHIASFYLLNYVEKFRKRFNNINIKIISDSTSLLINKLNHHELDFIIDCSPIDVDVKTMKIQQLEVFDTVFIAAYNYNFKIEKISDLNDKNLILPSPRSSFRKLLENSLSEYNINYKVGLSVDTTDLIISSVKMNLGIGYVIKDSVKKELANKEIREIKLDFELPKLELKLVYMKDYLSYPAKEFLKNYIKAI